MRGEDGTAVRELLLLLIPKMNLALFDRGFRDVRDGSDVAGSNPGESMRDHMIISREPDVAAAIMLGFRPTGPSLPCETCKVRASNLCHTLLGGSTRGRAFTQVHEVAARREVLFEADKATQYVHILCDGWAFRFRRLQNGRRHILSFLIPGDVVYAVSGTPGFAIQALTELRYCRFVRAEVRACLIEKPALFDAWTADEDAERARLAATAVALGRLDASERIAQLVLQLRDRLEARGQVNDGACAFPLRQSHIADATGLTTVHVSRTLTAFRRDGVFEIEEGNLRIFDAVRLRRISEGG